MTKNSNIYKPNIWRIWPLVPIKTSSPFIRATITITAATAGTGYASRTLANQMARVQAQRLAMQARTGAPVPAVPQAFEPSFFPQAAPAAAANMLAPAEVDFMREQQRVNQLMR
jgi:hypothetical protein